MSATNQLKELLQLQGLLNTSANQRVGNQYNSMSELNDLNTCLTSSTITTNEYNIGHNLPNNCTIKVDNSSTKCLYNVLASKVAIEGHESTNSEFTKTERLVDFNWESNRNCNWIAVNNRKPIIAYVISRFVRPQASKQSNVLITESSGNQMIRVMNYETRHRCLAKGVFHQPIADLAFAVNSVSSNSLDISKLSVADRGGNVYIYSLKEESGDIQAHQVLEIVNDGNLFETVRLSWCPYVPSDDDDTELEGDPGLTLALSCDNRLELFAIDLLQNLYKESVVVDIAKLRSSQTGYQLIDKAHDRPITSLSIAQEVTAICTTGLDDKIRFYSVALKGETNQKKFLKEWHLCKEYQFYEMDDHFSNFFFLDDFDHLLSQSEPIFWGYGLIGTRKGHIAVINLKDWRCKQTIRLISNETTDVSEEPFSYRMDLTAHYILAIRRNDAFLLHIHFPHDKEETDEDCDQIDNKDLIFDNSYPYVNKISRFQIYNWPLRSFTVKKSIDDNVMLFWINEHSLELCHIDLSSITIEEHFQTFETSNDKRIDNISESNALNNINSNSNVSTIIPNKDMDLMTEVSQMNGFEGFDTSLMTSMNTSLEPQVMSIPPTLPMTINKSPEKVSALNLLPIPPPPTTFTQSKPFVPQLPRPQSPASKEVQQIFSPSLATMSGTNALKSILAFGSTAQPNNGEESSLEPFGALFPSKLPNILKDVVKEEHILQLKTDVFNEIQDSESRVLQIIDRMDHKLSAKLNANNEQMLTNSKVQTNKMESDIRDLKKEMKNVCKIRNEEFNKIVEKLVNKVMHEMNVIIQKGFQELMSETNKEIKLVTKEFDKNIQTMQTKISQSIDNSKHFQPLALPMSATPITPQTPQTPQLSQQSYYATQTPTFVGQRKTPQPIANATPHSMPTTPLPYPTTPRSAYQTPDSQTPGADQLWQQKEQQKQLLVLKQKQQTQNEIWKCVGAGQLDQALTKALNLKDPELVVKICELFKDNPSQLIDRIKSDQLVLISLLQQIIYNRSQNVSEESHWKTGFIEQIITNLDLENEFVVKILPNLAPKLTQLLDYISKSANGPIGEKAKILAFTFKNLRL